MASEGAVTRVGRSKVTHTGSGLLISRAATKHYFVLIFMTAWLGGWAFGWMAAANTLFSQASGGAAGFLSFWLIAWTAGGLFAMGQVGWMFAGREHLGLEAGQIVLSRTMGPFSRVWRCDLNEVTHLRVVEDGSPNWSKSNGQKGFFSGVGSGTLRFDHNYKTFAFGLDMDAAEARDLCQRLQDADARLR